MLLLLPPAGQRWESTGQGLEAGMYSFRDLFDTMPSIPPGKGHLPQARSALGWGAARCDLLDVPPTPLQMTQASDRLSLPASSSAVCVPPSLSLSPCHVLSSSSCSQWVSAVFLSLVLSLFLCLIIFLSFPIFSLPPKLRVSFCLCISLPASLLRFSTHFRLGLQVNPLLSLEF